MTMKVMTGLVFSLAMATVVPLVHAQDARLFVDGVVVGEMPGASDVPVSDPIAEAVAQAAEAWQAFRSGEYREATAAILMFILFLWRRFAGVLIVGRLSEWQTALVAAVLGLLATLPAALTTDVFSPGTFVLQAFVTSAEAIALWHLVGKKVLPAMFGTVPPAEQTL